MEGQREGRFGSLQSEYSVLEYCTLKMVKMLSSVWCAFYMKKKNGESLALLVLSMLFLVG